MYDQDVLLQMQVKEVEEKPAEKEEDEEMTEEQQAAEKAKPVSSTPVPGTPWSANCLFWFQFLSNDFCCTIKLGI